MTIIANQFGFSTASGVVANMVDGNFAVGWAPLPTDFAAYPAQFFMPDRTTLNTAASFPALEFDLGEAKRVPQIFLKVQSFLTLGPALLIGSNVGATSPADTLQVGDLLLAQYTLEQINSSRFLDVPAMRDADIRKRFLRILQRSNDSSVIAPTPGPTNSVTYDLGLGSWEVVDYASKLTIEMWGGGASGGITSQAANGVASTAHRAAWGFTLTANGGVKATATVANAGPAGTGGTASNGNNTNTTGGNGGVPSPADNNNGLTGKGGDAPHGGLGGPSVFLPLVIGGGMMAYGKPGGAPGGGGSGRSYWYPAGDVIYQKFVGGGSGGYVKHVIDRLSGDADPGDFIDWVVGAGGLSSAGDGAGAQGRVRFSWT